MVSWIEDVLEDLSEAASVIEVLKLLIKSQLLSFLSLLFVLLCIGVVGLTLPFLDRASVLCSVFLAFAVLLLSWVHCDFCVEIAPIKEQLVQLAANLHRVVVPDGCEIDELAQEHAFRLAELHFLELFDLFPQLSSRFCVDLLALFFLELFKLFLGGRHVRFLGLEASSQSYRLL